MVCGPLVFSQSSIQHINKQTMKEQHPITKVIRTRTERSAEMEHSSPMFLTSSFVFDDAETMRAAFADETDDNDQVDEIFVVICEAVRKAVWKGLAKEGDVWFVEEAALVVVGRDAAVWVLGMALPSLMATSSMVRRKSSVVGWVKR